MNQLFYVSHWLREDLADDILHTDSSAEQARIAAEYIDWFIKYYDRK